MSVIAKYQGRQDFNMAHSFYCSNADVANRIGLDAGQRTRAASRLESVIRRASIEIDMCYRDYGRTSPTSHLAENTLNGAVTAGANSIVLTSGTDFSTAGNGNVDGDSFAWTGKSTHTLTGVTGLSFDHATGKTVQEGELSHVLKEVCADLAASYYMEDETAFQDRDSPRVANLKRRAEQSLHRAARLGTVD